MKYGWNPMIAVGVCRSTLPMPVLSEGRCRDRIVRRVGVLELETDDRAGRCPERKRRVTCRLAGVVFAPINARDDRPGRAPTRAPAVREPGPDGSDAGHRLHSSTIARKSCEISSLQPARGCAADRAQPDADAASRCERFHTRRTRARHLPGRRPAVRDPRADHVGADRRRPTR